MSLHSTTRFAAALLLSAAAAAASAAPPCQSRQIEGFDQPESAVETDDAIYVSNVGGAGGSGGFISKVDKRSLSIETLRFLPVSGGLDKPLGVLAVGDVLYVADLKRVRGYDLKTRAAVFELEIPEAGNLNDLALGSGPGEEPWLFVSDYYANKVFKVYPRRGAYAAFADVVGANGLAYDRATRTLYVAGLGAGSTSGAKPPYFGALYKVSRQGVATVLVETGTFLDGLALHRGRLYFSDWGSDLATGSLHSAPLRAPTRVRAEPTCAALRGPADFSRSASGRRWLIPALLDGKVRVESIAPGC